MSVMGNNKEYQIKLRSAMGLISMRELAKRSGVSYYVLKHFKAGDNNLGEEYITQIKKVIEEEFGFLLGGVRHEA